MDEITEAELLEMFDGEIPPTVYRTLANPKVIDKRGKLKKIAAVWAKRWKPGWPD